MSFLSLKMSRGREERWGRKGEEQKRAKRQTDGMCEDGSGGMRRHLLERQTSGHQYPHPLAFLTQHPPWALTL